MVSNGDIEDSYAVEVDQATESVPTLRRKLMTYVNLAAGDESGPGGAPLPRVLVTVPNERRLAVVRELVRGLPDPAEALVAITIQDHAVPLVVQTLQQ